MLILNRSSLIALSFVLLPQGGQAEDVNIGLDMGTFSQQYESSVVEGWRATTFSNVKVHNIPNGPATAVEDGLEVLMLSGAEEYTLCKEGALARVNETMGLDLSHLTSPTNCGVPFVSYGQTISFNSSVFGRPIGVADFFDIEGLPGGRALHDDPKGLLEMALLADGIERDNIYETLATEQGLARALNKLDQVKPRVIWTDTTTATINLLRSGDIALGVTWSGSLNAAKQQGLALSSTKDFMLVEHSYLAVPASAARSEGAESFLKYATSPAGFERFVEGTGGKFSVPADEIKHGFPDDEIFAQACSGNTCPCGGISGGCRSNCCRDQDGIFGHFEVDDGFWEENGDRLKSAFEAWRLE